MKNIKFYFILCLMTLINVSLMAKNIAVDIPEPMEVSLMHFQFRFDDTYMGKHVHGKLEDDERLRDFSVSVWVKLRTTTSGDIFGHAEFAKYGVLGSFAVSIQDGKLGIRNRSLLNNEGILETPAQEDLYSEETVSDEWMFLTLTVSSTDKIMKLYKNGVQILEKEILNDGLGYVADAGIFFCANSRLSTYLDEYHVWDRALTAKEVKASMKGRYTDIPDGLIYYWDFSNKDESSNTYANKGKGGSTVSGSVYYGRIYKDTPETYSGPGVYSRFKEVDGRPDTPLHILTYNGTTTEGTFAVKEDTEIIESGTEVFEGTLLTVEAVPNPGFEVATIKVNNTPIEGNTFILEEPSTVTVEFKDVMGTAIHIPVPENNIKYQFRFDDALLGSHTDGSPDNDNRSRNITMSAWIKPASQTGNIFGHVQEAFYATQGSFSVTLTNGKLGIRSRYWESGEKCPDDINAVSDVNLSTEEWAFITLVINDEDRSIKLYKNGEVALEKPMKETGNGIGLLADKSVFFVGNHGFSADIDEVQVWNKVLSEEEITGSMSKYEAVPENLIYLYHFTEMNSSDLTFANKGSGGECFAALYQGVHSGNDYSATAPITPEFVIGHISENYLLTYEENVTGGTISIESNNVKIESGSEISRSTLLTVIATPATGFQLKTIRVNGNIIQGNTFRIVENSVVTVEFTDKLLATYIVEGNGSLSITENGTNPIENNGEFTNGSSMVITLIPDEGHEISTFIVNEEDKKADITDNKYTIENCNENLNINVKYDIKKYAVNYASDENGSITIHSGKSVVGNGTEVEHGAGIIITLTPGDKETSIESFTINGSDRRGDLINNTIELTVTEVLNISATFKPAFYVLTYNTPGNGTIKITQDDVEISSGNEVQKGKYLLVSLTADTGYKIEYLKINDIDVTGDIDPDENSYWIEMKQNTNVVASFVSDGTNILDTEADNISAYYNRTNETLYINGLTENGLVSLYNVVGNAIILEEKENAINVSKLPDGIYLVKIEIGKIEKAIKFIK